MDVPDRDPHLMKVLANSWLRGPYANKVGVDILTGSEPEQGLVLRVVVDVTLCFKVESREEAEREAESEKGVCLCQNAREGVL
jgi:hypothetical protein